MILNREYYLNKENNNYFLSLNDKIYQINQYYFFLLSLQKKEICYSDQLLKLKEKFGLNSNQIELISSEFEKFILNLDKTGNRKNKDYIKCKRIIINSKVVNRFATKLKFLFNNKILIILLPTIVILNVYFISTIPINSDYQLHWSGYLFIAFSVSLLAIFHELGHASALIGCGQKPYEIGIGIYFIFPVFYSKVNSAWLLPLRKKILVNAGGIYFQLLLNALIIIIIFLPLDMQDDLFQILEIIAVYNISLVIYNLLPFLRQDGYWIYSDLFGVSNLMYRANSIHKEIRSSKMKNIWPIALYSVANWFFRIYILVVLVRLLIKSLSDFNSHNFGKELFTTYLFALLSALGLFLMLNNIVKILTHKIDINEGY